MTTLFTHKAKKTGTTFELDFDALPGNAREKVIQYGIDQYLADAHASLSIKGLADKPLADMRKDVDAAITERLEALRSGVLKTKREGGPRVSRDPVMAEFRRIALTVITGRLAYGAIADADGKKAYREAEMKAAIAAPPVKWMDRAKANVAANAELLEE